MDRTGNPFVDMGLCVITVLAGKECIADLNMEDVERVWDENDLIEINNTLKSCFIMLFHNNPLSQPAFRPNNKGIYKSFLQSLLKESKSTQGDNICEICGDKYSMEINTVWRKIANDYGIKRKGEKYLGRDFFPLVGSLGNDSQALPGASKMLGICPRCLLFVNYIPLGTMLMDGRLVCIESDSELIMLELIKDIIEKNKVIKSTGKKEIYGKHEGNGEIYYRLLSMFNRLQNIKKQELLPSFISLSFWLFSNFGDKANCEIIEIPNSSLQFLWQACRRPEGLKNELLQLINYDKKGKLFECINQREDCYLLYPKGKYSGVSPELYEFYQNEVVGRGKRVLRFAKELARRLVSDTQKKEIARLQKSDAFGGKGLEGSRNQALVNKQIVQMILDGAADYEDYLGLFNADRKYLIRDYEAFNVITYYLNNLQWEGEENLEMKVESRHTHQKIKEFAQAYFHYYLDKESGLGRSIERFKKDVLDRFDEFGEYWLRERFVKMAEIYELNNLRLDYDGWLDFITDENGNRRMTELLFQLRLALANLYREYMKEGKENE